MVEIFSEEWVIVVIFTLAERTNKYISKNSDGFSTFEKANLRKHFRKPINSGKAEMKCKSELKMYNTRFYLKKKLNTKPMEDVKTEQFVPKMKNQKSKISKNICDKYPS
ncbi:unnamed protein product [Moneuplotes crassus]|uniref:Uncharacterized protein n=1 Tax=Euplotes crassus TaxID=5936 RepID=A0AAD1UP25_EUPCR|nr:unnamed protein product [Moneuplotes crassus]